MRLRWFVLSFAWFAFFHIEAIAQEWNIVRQISGPGTETVAHIEVAENGNTFYVGIYDQEQTWNGNPLQLIGEKDVYVAGMDPEGGLLWVIAGGSVMDDEALGLAMDADGNLLVCGSFWFTADFGHITLSAGANPKGLFLLKISPEGAILWGKALGGSGIKGAGGLVADQDGNIWMSGFFGGQLQIGDTTLTALGNTDMFLAKFNPEGVLNWSLREGLSGDTRSTALALTVGGEPVTGGYFNATTQIAGQTYTANTSDRDVFIAAYTASGQPKWAAKAGGVHDDELTDISVNEHGDVFACGYFVGVMTLGNDLGIQSNSGSPDAFLLRYQEDGTPLRARALGGQLTEIASGLDVKGGRIALCGHFLGNLSWDGWSTFSGNSYAGFFALFDEMLEGTWLHSVSASGGVYPGQIRIAPNGTLWSCGSFGGIGAFPTGTLTAQGVFDGFLLGSSSTVSSTILIPPISISIYPNPAFHEIHLTGKQVGDRVWIMNTSGIILSGPFLDNPINISTLSSGIYVLLLERKGSTKAIRFLKPD